MEHDRESYAEAEESSGLGGAIRFQAPVDMELLRIPLLVVLGQAEISARHLFELSTGQRIEFEFDPNLPVRLVIGGETIARGRLVRRGSALAVEVVSPHDTGEAASAGPDKISSQEVNSFEISENL